MAREPAEIAAQRRRLGERLFAFRTAAGLTQSELARMVFRHRTALVHIEKGRRRGDEHFWFAVDATVGADGALLEGFREIEANKQADVQRLRAAKLAEVHLSLAGTDLNSNHAADEEAALEFARQLTASDLGHETLTRLELIVDELASKYPTTSSRDLLARLRLHLSHVSTLMDKRLTLAEHRRLLVIAGWLSLLTATVHIDLKETKAALVHLRTAASLGRHAGHNEIRGWCYETEAWRALTDGHYHRALKLSQAAQAIAPSGSSVTAQATAQEGRAWARLDEPKNSYDAIGRLHKLVSPMSRPDRPEHHYRYDPDKSIAYTATTLAWLGDPAAESYARELIARLKPTDDFVKWPRRVASAKLDLALSLLVSSRIDEACDAAKQAMLSGRVVPSNYWRAAEVVRAVEARQLPEADDLREVYEGLRYQPT